MTTSSSVCVDASLLIKLPVPEILSENAREAWAAWVESDVARYAPLLLRYETVSILNKKVRAGSLDTSIARAALDFILDADIDVVDTEEMHRRALDLARDLDLGSAYDAHYLALAEELDCELWTADGRLYNAVRARFPLIRYIGA